MLLFIVANYLGTTTYTETTLLFTYAQVVGLLMFVPGQ